MINEYALEPAVLSSWALSDRDYAEFMREYGLGTPRVISSFPKQKASKLRSYLLRLGPADSQSIAGKRYTEMVLKLVESVVVREVQNYQIADWKEVVVVENRRVPFDVILSSTEIEDANNITPCSMYSQGSIWNHPGQVNVSRTNESLLSVFSNFIRLAENKIVIIDPYGWKREAVEFIQCMLQSISDNRVTGRLPAIMLFYKEKCGGNHGGRSSPPAARIKDLIKKGLTGVSSSLEVQVFELRETTDVFHNRCILTEHGGVMTGHGITLSGEVPHTDEATLMNLDIYQKKWRQFVEQNRYEVVSKA